MIILVGVLMAIKDWKKRNKLILIGILLVWLTLWSFGFGYWFRGIV